MLKLTKTGIGLLTNQYRSVLRKCLLLNFCIVGMLFFSKPVASAISHDMLSRMLMPVDEFSILDSGYVSNMSGISRQLAESGHYFSPLVSWINGRHEWSGATVWGNLLALDNALYNYYYTFRVDERIEAAEFALFLDNEKLSSVFEA